jgi:hypothetical protein
MGNILNNSIPEYGKDHDRGKRKSDGSRFRKESLLIMSSEAIVQALRKQGGSVYTIILLHG